MDIMVLVVLVIAAFVALEFLGFRAYKRHKAKKEALFTKDELAEVYDDLQSTRAFCLGAKRAYRDLAARAAQAEGGDAERDAAILEALAEGEKSHLAELETFRERLHAEAVEACTMPLEGLSLDEALRECAKRTDEWSAGPCAEYAARARLRGYADISRMYKRIQEVENLYAGICLDVAEGGKDGLGDLSRCPSCGTVVSGRRPAFCTVCTQPGFEFVAVERVEAEAEVAQGEQAKLAG